MPNPYQQYAKVADSAGMSQRGLEAAILLAAARELQRVVDHWEDEADQLDAALEKNKVAWTFIASEVTDNPNLPDEVKQNVLNLSLFIFKRTLQLTGTPTRQGVAPLININRVLAQGLSEEQA